MSEPNHDTSITPLAAIRCYNADCGYYDTRYTDQCSADPTVPVDGCPKYRTAAAQAETAKITAVDDLRTELAQARTELADIRRAMEMLGAVLPDIDEDTYEYSAVGEEKLGEWPDLWAEGWVPRERKLDMSHALLRRRRRVRRPPTDADAIDQPRRECWVLIGGQWIDAQLLLVAAAGVKSLYLVMCSESSAGWFQQCEIEVEACK